MELPLGEPSPQGRNRLPWKLMKVGDHFFVPNPPDPEKLTAADLPAQSEVWTQTQTKLRQYIAVKKTRKNYKGQEYFCCRDTVNGRDGVRVWRMK